VIKEAPGIGLSTVDDNKKPADFVRKIVISGALEKPGRREACTGCEMA
jgi:hypothetical protein